jgi:hypothetical protein
MAKNSIPKGLGTVKDLIKRAGNAASNWELWRSLHQEAFDFAAPQRETFRFWSPGQRKNRHIFDSTAVDGLVTFANKIQGSVIPSWMEWMKLEAGSDVPKEDKNKVDKLLEKTTTAFFSNLNHSNFSTEITPGLSDLGIGTGAILIEEGEFAKETSLKFSNVPLAELNPEHPADGPIKNVWRNREVEARNIKETWPEAILPQELEEKIKKNPFCKVKILNGMLFNPEDRLYWQIVIHKASNSVLFTQSFKTRRLIVFRWHVTPGEVFGRGPIISKLPDIRTVNKVKQFILENGAIQMAGVYTGVDDGVFNPHTVRIAPGTIIPVTSNATANPTVRALERAGDLGLGAIILEDLQNSIKEALFANPLGEVTDPVKSATEQMLRMQEALKQRGASFGRLKTELIEPLVAAAVDILRGLGQVPEISVDGKDVTLKMTSPLSKSEDMEDFQNSQVWWQNVSTLMPEIVAGTVKIEDLPKYWQEKLSVPADLIRSEDERQEFGEKIMAAAQTQVQGGVDEPAG